jgi:poly-D-alanine transfer protein DltD
MCKDIQDKFSYLLTEEYQTLKELLNLLSKALNLAEFIALVLETVLQNH